MADYYGRYPHIECSNCHSLYPEHTWDGKSWEHVCDKTRSHCSECGILHDGYSSSTTGISPCLSALKHRLDTLENMLNTVLALKTHGMNEDIFRAIVRGKDNPTARMQESEGKTDKPDSSAILPES